MARARQATLVVPLVALVGHGLAVVPALHGALDLTWSEATLCGIASGFASLAAATRWVTGRPPDFGRPLVSSPAGGIPTNLYGSVMRGFDVLLLACAPVLPVPTSTGAVASILVAAVVLVYLTGRE